MAGPLLKSGQARQSSQYNGNRSGQGFEDALRKNHKGISPSMIYAYAAIKCGAAYANGAPNLSVDIPALEKLSLCVTECPFELNPLSLFLNSKNTDMFICNVLLKSDKDDSVLFIFEYI